MPGTILKNDLQDTIEQQLGQYARSLQQSAQGALSSAGDTLEDLQRAGRTSVQDMQAQLSDYATRAFNAAQQAQLDAQAQAQQQQQAVQQHLTDYANQVAAGGQQQQQPTQQAALPHNEEPGTATDVRQGGDLGSRWKTQFDFGATYTGDYRTGTPHRGVDIVPSNGSGIGAEVDAFAPGTVTLIQRDSGAGGLMVYVQDADGLTHAYMHLAGTAPGLKVGDQVQRGQPIAQMGESGTEGSPHLHYEVRKNASTGDPLNQLIDPRPYETGAKQPGMGGPGGVAQSAVQGAQTAIGQGKDAFIQTLAPLAKRVSDQTGIDPALLLAFAGHETGWGQSENAQTKNNLFSIQGASQQGGRWAGYNSPQESFQAFVDLVSQAPRYAQAWADRANPEQFIQDLRKAGYVADEPGFPAQGWVDGVLRNFATIKGQVDQAVGGAQQAAGTAVAGARRNAGDVMMAGEPTPAAREPIYMSTMQGGEQQSPMQQLSALQDQLDALRNQLAGGVEQAAAGARKALEPYNEPPLAAGAPARQAIEQAAGGVQQAYGGLVQGAQDVGGAVAGAATRPLGETFPQLAGGTDLAARNAQRQRAEQEAQAVAAAGQEQNRRAAEMMAHPEQHIGEFAGDVWNQIIGANPPFGISWQQYQDTMAAKNEWIDRNNPARGTIAGDLAAGLVEQITDPLNLVVMFGTGGIGRAIGEAAGAGVTGRLAGTMAPGATRLVANVAERFAQGAANNAIQSAAYEAAQPNPDPLKVGQAFALGLGLGGVLDVSIPAVAGQVRRMGQQIIDRAPELLRARQRGEVDLGLITTGEPTPREQVIPPRPPDELVTPRFPNVPREGAAPPTEAVAGVQRLPNVTAGTPEAGFEALARASRESSPDRVAHIDLNTVPKDVLPFDRNATAADEGIVKLNPGGMPSMDDLRALYRANEHKSSFYVDQGDSAASMVGPDNTGELFTLGAINSMQTGVSRQVAESIQAIGLVRKVARDGRAQGLTAEQIKENILEALADNAQNTLAGPAKANKLKGQLAAYETGESQVKSGAKTSVFSGNYTSGEGRFFDPRVTNDIHNWRIMNVSSDKIPALRKNPRTGEQEWFIDQPHESSVASNDRAYRGVESVWNELAREAGVDGYALQSAMWDGIRAMQLRDPVAWRMWQQGFFQRAVERAQSRGVFGLPTDAIDNPGDIQRVMNSAPVKRELAKWADYLKDPLPPELGIGSPQRVFAGKRLGRGKAAPAPKPSSRAFREAERAIAESDAPLVRGLDDNTVERLGYDPERGVFPWLESSHRVEHVGPDEWVVHLPGGNEDTARYVAATVGTAADADATRMHIPDYQSPDIAGIAARGTADEIKVLQGALDNMGVTTVKGTTRTSLQIPFERVNSKPEQDAVIDAAKSVDFPLDGLNTYQGRTADVPRSDYAATREQLAATFAPTTAERSAVLERGLGVRPAEAAPPTGPPDILRGRQRGEASLPFSFNVGGAALGAYAGNVATPEDAPLEERLRNIGVGGLAGLAGAHLLSHGGPRLAAERAGRAAEGFRAPGRPETPELRATTQEPPGGPTGPGERPPTRLEDVRSNPYALREARPNETPMTPDEMLEYADELETRLQDVQNRKDAVDEMIRNPSQKIERPPWAAGYTDVQLAEIARRHDISPYQEAWWDTVGLESGSGEVRYDVGESGLRGTPSQKQLSKTELRAEARRLDQEMGNITAAYDQMSNAPAEPNLVRVASVREAAAAQRGLPFDSGAPEAAPVTEAQGGLDEGARLAQEVVLGKGKGTLRSGEGEVSLTGADVGGTALISHEAIQRATETPPSARTVANMPNLDSMLEGDMPEIAAQIRKAAEDHADLMELYRQGVITQDSLKNDLAKRVGMTLEDWKNTPVGKGFNPEEMVALQAAAIEAQGRAEDMGRAILALDGGVDSLSPERLAFSAATLADATRVLAVARGGRTTAGRTLNALKNRFDRTLAQGITASNEKLAHLRTAAKARRAAAKASAVLQKGRVLETEATAAKAEAVKRNAPKNILDQIADAYDQLDRYNAMTLHEKGVEFDRLKAERAKRAAARKERVRGAPEELLSALQAELKAEQKIFAGRKDTWETMAFWDTKAAEIAAEKRRGFRGQLYIEQQRRVAQIAAKGAEKDAARAFDDELKGRQKQTERATRVLEAIGGEKVTKDLLRAYIATLNDPSPEATAKFLKGIAPQNHWARANIVRIAGLVSAPITHAVNVGGNTVMAQVEHFAVRPLVVVIDAMRSGITGGERQAFKAELLPALQAQGPGAVGALPKVLRALKTGINPYEAENLDLARVRAGFASGNEVVDAAVEMPLRALTAEDVMFREMALSYHGMRVAMREATREGFRGNAAKGRADNIMRNLEDYPELAQEVDDAARREVFQERRGNIPLMGSGPREANVALIESQVLPFVRTPTNITAQGVAMSPLGFGGALQAARATRGMPTGTRLERYARGRQVLLAEERLARATIGTGILAASVWWGAQGRLTADYPQDEKARSALPQGWRPWSFKVDDPITKNTYYVPMQNLGPIGVPMAMAAIVTDPTHHGKTILDPDEWGQAAFGVGRYVLDSTYLQGLSDFLDMAQDPRANFAKFAEPLVASYGPYSSLMREAQRTFGIAQRNPREGARGLIDAMLANYPGTSGMVPPALTPLGDERTQGATGLGRVLTPARYDIERDEPTLAVLRTSGVGVPRTPKAVGLKGGSIELTEDERAVLQRMRGQAIRDAVRTVDRDPRNVDKAVKLATANANARFLDSLGTAAINKRWEPKEAPEPYYLGAATGT